MSDNQIINLYEKLQVIKQEIVDSKLKKTGKNKYAGFEYFELCDILPTIIKLCNEHKVFTTISFGKEVATLTAINCENTNEKLEITSPMEELEMKGCNKVQALGGVETYQRRYLYLSLFDITENDMFDSTNQEIKSEIKSPVAKPTAVKIDPKELVCSVCGNNIEDTTINGTNYSAQDIYMINKKRYGVAMCDKCSSKAKETKEKSN